MMWLWAVLPWGLLLTALLVLAWALFRDRPGLWGVPRERCPKCRYDMAGRDTSETPIVCPECGKAIRDGRSLTKTRRRWGMVLLTVPLLVGWHLAERKEEIRRHGWISVVPTIALMPFVKFDDWYQLTLKESQLTGQPTDLSELLHRRLVQSDALMGLWLFIVRYRLREEQVVVVDASDVAPIRYGRIVDPWTSMPSNSVFNYGEPVPDEQLQSELREAVLSSVDPHAWIDTGSEWHGPYRRAGDRLLVHATPDVIVAIEQLITLISLASENPAFSHHARIHGKNFFVVSLAYFESGDWFARDLSRAIEDERESRRLVEEAIRLGLGGGGGGDGPWGGGRLLFGESYAAQRVRDEFMTPIFLSLQHESGQRHWADFGGEYIDARWVGSTLVVFSDWEESYFRSAIERIRDLGPDAILKEHGVEP